MANKESINDMLNRRDAQSDPILHAQSVMNTLNSATNPQAAVEQLAQTDDTVRTAYQFMQESGGDPKTAALNLAKKYGINPWNFVGMFRR